ncbi:MAG TPA: adenylate/guanylate cyclase domain-containing protein [Rhizomicrobium sp.]|jgi:class 3 adenylate cyclase|nr:adenylate/guanylate cyclase domain-containing protein [Rhizomicrobium sp.]
MNVWLARLWTFVRRKKVIDRATAVAAALVVAVLAMLAVDKISFLTSADRFVQDWQIATRSPIEPQDTNVVVVAVQEATLEHFAYRAPLDRDFLAKLLTGLDAKHPRAIVLDYLFDQPTETDKDDRLRQVLRTMKTPLVVSYFETGGETSPEQIRYLRDFVPAGARAAANIGTDQTDTVRWILPGVRGADGTWLPSVPVKVASILGLHPPDKRVPIAWRADPGQNESAFSEIPACLIGWTGCLATALYPPAFFKGKVVLIGSDMTLVDQHATPFATAPRLNKPTMPGIMTFAYAIAQLMEHRDPPQLSWFANFAIALVFAGLGALIGLIDLALWLRGAMVAVLVGVLWYLGVWALYEHAGILIGLIAPTLALIVAFAVVDSITGFAARRARHFIQSTFSLYVPPRLVQQLEEHPEQLVLGGERRDLGLLFTDIHGFTTMAEGLDSKDVGRVLNAYLDGMTAAIQKHEGTIDKFIGDAVFALWNAPLDVDDYATKSVRCALDMDLFTESFRKEMNAEGIPLSYTRIGVHAGAAAVGNFGSRHRFSYTASGDAVNAASRLEGLNKTFGTRLCVSGATRVLCKGIAFRPIGSVVLKGKTEALDVFEPLHEGALSASYLARYEEAYAACHDGHADALALFGALAKENPDDPLVRFYVERLAQGETGIKIKMTEK